jgi:GNAT superfamily N-acetyltransferase
LNARSVAVRCIAQSDFDAWLPLWDGYNAFYGRQGTTALPIAVTQATWQRFLDPAEPVFGLVAEAQGQLLGLCHYLFHRSTTRIEPICYLQDLFTVTHARGRGVGRALIEAVYEGAKLHGARRVYWQTQEANSAARRLYEKVATHHGFMVYAHDL